MLLASFMMLNAQDFDATGTALVVGATQTAIVEASHAVELATDDPFALTATALVRAATQTAEVSTGRTAVPITAEAQSDGSFELTATTLVQEATQNALEGTPPSLGTGPTPEDANVFALSATFFIFAGLLVALVVLGAIVVIVGRRNIGKRG